MADATLTAVLELKDSMSQGLAKVSDALKKLQEQSKSMTAATSAMSSSSNTFGKTMSGVAQNVATAALILKTFIATRVAGFLIGATKEALAFAESMERLASATGLSTDAMQKYTFAAKAAGAETTDLQMAFKILQIRAQAAASGSLEAQASFLALGIDLKNERGLLDDNEALFRRVVDALKNVKTQSEFTSLGTELMGREFVHLANLVKGGTEQIDQYSAILERTGGIVTPEVIANLQAFDTQVKLLTTSWNALKTAFISVMLNEGVLPTIIRTFGEVSASLISVRKYVEGFVMALGGMAGAIYRVIKGAMSDLLNTINNLSTAMDELKSGRLTQAALDAASAWNNIQKLPANAAENFSSAMLIMTKDIDQMAADLDDAAERARFDSNQIADDLQLIANNSKRLSDQQSKDTASIVQGSKEQSAAAEKLAKDTIFWDRVAAKMAQDSAKTRRQAIEEVLKEMQQERDAASKLAKELSNFQIAVGFNNAVDEWTSSLITFKDVFTNIFSSMQNGLSVFFQSLMTKGHNWKEAMKAWFDDVKRSFIKMLADMLAQQLMMSAMGLFGVGGGGFASPGGGNAPNQSNLPMGAPGGGSAGGILGTLGISPVAGLAIGAEIAGISYVANKGLSGDWSPKKMAMAGSLLGPAGAIIGYAIGKFGKKKKKKKQAEAEAAAAAAQAAYEEQVRQAGELIKTSTRTQMGGGMATTEAADTIGELFSGGISAGEVEKFGGAANVIAKQQEIRALANNVSLQAPITINATVNGSYDVQRLAEDLRFYMGNALQSGAGAR